MLANHNAANLNNESDKLRIILIINIFLTLDNFILREYAHPVVDFGVRFEGSVWLFGEGGAVIIVLIFTFLVLFFVQVCGDEVINTDFSEHVDEEDEGRVFF